MRNIIIILMKYKLEAVIAFFLVLSLTFQIRNKELSGKIVELTEQLEESKLDVEKQRGIIRDEVRSRAKNIENRLTNISDPKNLPDTFPKFRIVLEVEPKQPYTKAEVFSGVRHLCQSVLAFSPLQSMSAIAVAGLVEIDGRGIYVVLSQDSIDS